MPERQYFAPSRSQLLRVFESLLGRYGPQQWWPAETPFEVMVGAVLTQNTAWQNVERAISNLKRTGRLDPEAIIALAPGDLVAFRSAGAYGAVMASEYNTRPLIPEVLVHGDQFAVIRPRPTFDEMISRDNIPEWLS